MNPFEYFVGFFSLIMGLAAVILATGLADMLKARQAVKVGVLTPLLALFMLMDISTFWASGWLGMQDLQISYATIYIGLLVTLPYVLAASLVFPRDPAEWPSLDDYYVGHKRMALAGVIFSNAIGLFWSNWGEMGELSLLQGLRLCLFFGALAGLILLRGRRINIALLVLLCLINLLPALAPSLSPSSGA